MNVTESFGYPLPENPAPRENVEFEKGTGRYLLPHLTQNNKPRQAFNRDKALLDVHNPKSSIDHYNSVRNIVAIAQDPSLLNNFPFNGTRPEIEQAARELDRRIDTTMNVKRQFGEWGMAMSQWVAALEFGTASYSEVSEYFRPYIDRYIHLRAAYGLSLDRDLSHRFVYNSATDSVSSTGLVYILPDGRRALAHIHTMASDPDARKEKSWMESKSEDHRPIVSDAVQGANVISGDKIVAPGSKSWLPLPEELASSEIIQLFAPRNILEFNVVRVSRETALDLLEVAARVLSDRDDILSRGTQGVPLGIVDPTEAVQTTTSAPMLFRLFKQDGGDWDPQVMELGKAQIIPDTASPSL